MSGARAAPGFHIVDRPRVWDRGEIEKAARAGAEALATAGITAGEPVAIVAENGAASAIAILAVRQARAVPAPLHPRLAPSEIDALVSRLGARLVIADEAAPVSRLAAAPAASFATRPRVPHLRGSGRILEADYALFTSGTEGRPKGILFRDAGFQWHAAAVARRLPSSEEDRWLATISFAHVGGLAPLLRAAHLGVGLVVPPDPLLPGLGDFLASHRITHVPLVPTVFQRWLSLEREKPPPATLRAVLVGGAALSPGVHEEALRFGWPVRTTYGFTEAGSQVATARGDTPPGSVGPPLDGVQVRIAGEGATGTILVRTPAACSGYLDARRPSQEWIETEDLGRIDSQGNLWILGRRADLIVSGGENVDAAEVASVVASHPRVEDAAILGVPDPEWGDAVVAFVVLKAGQRLELEELRTFCSSRLARFKCPKRLVILDAIPRTPTGKVRGSQLRSSLASASA